MVPIEVKNDVRGPEIEVVKEVEGCHGQQNHKYCGFEEFHLRKPVFVVVRKTGVFVLEFGRR